MTGRCQDATPLLGPLADGELPAADAAWVREHLDGCPACRDRQALTSATALALREGLSARADLVDFSAMTNRVMARIEAERPAPFAERLAVWWRETFAAPRAALGFGAGLTAAAALAVVLVLRPAVPAGESAADRPLALAANDAEQAQQAQIEELDVYGQEGTVLQLQNQTVIWVDDEPARKGTAQ